MEREWGENPLRELSVYAPKFLYPLAKAGHWETEKAGYKNADICLYGASHKTCFGAVFTMRLLRREGVFVCGIVAHASKL